MTATATLMQEPISSTASAHHLAEDMADLAELIRTLLDIDRGQDTRVRLGGTLFDVVITSSGLQACAAVDLMDAVQDGCGPVIEDPESGWLYWLVPPGSYSRWAPHSHAVCLGAPHTITLPSLTRSTPPGPYWVRPPASDRLIPTGPLREALAQFRPEPTPHAALAARFEITS
ncbi:hypothetical protein M2271_007261 [Streptomyces sp. LBL]|uniref:hypothetical protein n=1 Tax=Streptomyces sp. LBL TaxID=2940562 RepID=UPI0024762389|nr:hypothetical protein [Streptomyces sp. LBL]MDH6629425.1 hypothetical protein [Streptomyces sp. LBL]